MGPMWPFLLMYGSHDKRHAGFRRLTVVNGPSVFGASHLSLEFLACLERVVAVSLKFKDPSNYGMSNWVILGKT